MQWLTDEGIQQFWDLESLSVKGDDCSTQKNFDEIVAFKDGRYQGVRQPWKETDTSYPSRQLSTQQEKIVWIIAPSRAAMSTLRDCDATIKEQLSKGIVEQVDDSEPSILRATRYIPHHPVIRQETTKLRVATLRPHSMSDANLGCQFDISREWADWHCSSGREIGPQLRQWSSINW